MSKDSCKFGLLEVVIIRPYIKKAKKEIFAVAIHSVRIKTSKYRLLIKYNVGDIAIKMK